MEKQSVESALFFAAQKLEIPSFKPEQERVIKAFMSGRDVFVSLPTGFGKSACYGCLPVVFDCTRGVAAGCSIVLVVSPLKALMKNQVCSFRSKGILAVYVGDSRVDDATKCDIIGGRYQILFVSPEHLLCNLEWREMLRLPVYQENLVALVVDEAHCVKDWLVIILQNTWEILLYY